MRLAGASPASPATDGSFGSASSRLQARDVFSLAISAQIVDHGIVVMDANVCRGDWVSSKLVAVKGLDDVLKRLRLSRRGSSENGGDEGRSGHELLTSKSSLRSQEGMALRSK